MKIEEKQEDMLSLIIVMLRFLINNLKMVAL